MNWGGWDNFLAMGGYAFYVWGSYLAALGLMIAEIVLLALRKRGVLGRLRAGRPGDR
jgi:heme exporter protein D